MKTKQEIVSDLLEKSEEAMIRIDIRMGFLQRKHAEEEKQQYLQELAQLTADRRETEEWIAYLKEAGK